MDEGLATPDHIPWCQEIRERFTARFLQVKKHNDQNNPDLPFRYLASDGFWQAYEPNGTSSINREIRIIQRFGRIDRIGSRNKTVSLVNFWPTKDLDAYLNVKNRVEDRMALVDLTASGEDNLLASNQIEDLIKTDLHYRNKQLKRLKDEILDLEDLDDEMISLG